MLSVWGRVNSINVQKVMWTLAELELAHERVDVGGTFGGLDTPEFGVMNPNRKIPVLQDGPLVLWESNVIVRYLASRYGPEDGLYPRDLVKRAQAEMWMDWHVSTVQPAMGPAFWVLVRKSADFSSEDMRRSEKEMAGAFQILEDWLIGRDYMLGRALTMADVPLGASAHRWYSLPIERPNLPRVESWYRRLAERPAFAEHVMLPLT